MSDPLLVWTIYKRPKDAPRHYVVRSWSCGRPTPEPGPAYAVDTLEQARALVPKGLYRLDRDPKDDPVIVETWI